MTTHIQHSNERTNQHDVTIIVSAGLSNSTSKTQNQELWTHNPPFFRIGLKPNAQSNHSSYSREWYRERVKLFTCDFVEQWEIVDNKQKIIRSVDKLGSRKLQVKCRTLNSKFICYLHVNPKLENTFHNRSKQYHHIKLNIF